MLSKKSVFILMHIKSSSPTNIAFRSQGVFLRDTRFFFIEKRSLKNFPQDGANSQFGFPVIPNLAKKIAKLGISDA